MDLLPKAVTRPANRLGAAAQNALEVIRFGGLETGEQGSPFDIVARQRLYRLRRYFPPDDGVAQARPPIVLVPPLMLTAEVYDVSPASSAVTVLHAGGVDPWVVDFGAPEREEGGLQRTLTDHVLAVSDAIDRVRAMTGRDVHLAGYSQGGMFCYQTAAYRRSAGLRSLVTFGSPVDVRGALPLGIPEEVAAGVATFLVDNLLGRHAVPGWVSRFGFRMLDPVKSLRQRLEFIKQLHDREALLPRERQRRFLDAEGWVAWPGPALADFIHQFVTHNRMLQGGFVIDQRMVTLADISCPVLCVVGEVDEIAPPAAVRAFKRAAPRAETYQLSLRAGHFGLVVGSTATVTTWPAVAAWTHWLDSDRKLPGSVEPMPAQAPSDERPRVRARLGYGIELVTDTGIGVARSVVGTATGTVRTVGQLAVAAATELPRLTRLEGVQPRTRISLGLLIDEQAEEHPRGVSFLWEERAHTHEAVKYRVDSVVRGLISLGVRRGEHVGVLMETRPSALAVVAALNRLGAVAVLLRPDGPTDREVQLGHVGRIVADPPHAAHAAERRDVQVLVLGGGAEPRDLGIPGVVDMERIDPEAVELPAWYRPNPGRASDLAFILFSGEGERTRAKAITNGRWVLSAFGTASSAALSSADTVYSITPIHHPSGLLMSIGGAIAGGARIALATTFDADNFWAEVRRYGATIVSYTWTLLHELVEAPPHAGEHHHPVRMFIGSGMPRGLWRRVITRFSPAEVLEFYASTEGDAVLVNLTGVKPGCKGRPLPGSAEVRLAAYDAEAGRLEETGEGLVRAADAGEVGMLLSRVRPDMVSTSTSPLRGVFERDDAWLPTRDLFRRDEDGDYWLVDHAPALIRTARGMVASFPIQDALGDLDEVDLAVAYGVPTAREEVELAVVAVRLRTGRELDPGALTDALSVLPPDERPAVVHVVDSIPVNTWYRPLTGPLRQAGVPAAGGKRPAFAYDRAKHAYRPLTAATRTRLLRDGGAGRRPAAAAAR